MKKSTCVCIDAWYSVANYRAEAWVWVWILRKKSPRTLCCLVFFQLWELRDAFGIFCTSKTVHVPSPTTIPPSSEPPLVHPFSKLCTENRHFSKSTCNQWSYVLIKEKTYLKLLFSFLQLENGGWEIGSRKDWDPKAIHHGKKVFLHVFM